MLLSSREKILLHLFEESRNLPLQTRVMPASLSQEGISDSTGVARKHIPRNLKALMGKELIEEHKAHIMGVSQRRKTYLPTSKGRDEANMVKQKVLSTKIIYRTGNDLAVDDNDDDDDVELTFEQAMRRFSKAHPNEKTDILLFIRTLCEETTCDVMEEKRILSALNPEIKQIKHLGNAPKIREFVGRQKERDDVLTLLSDRKMIVIYGITGIGKSAFGSNLAKLHNGNVYWYSFHEWDTLQSLQRPLSKFLEEIGKGGLALKESGLDINGFVSIVKDALNHTGSLIVLDDIQKAPDEFNPLLMGIIEVLEDLENVTFLILSRKIPDLYSRRDVMIKKTIAEYMLEGLDKASCKNLLANRGFPGDMLDNVYSLTHGHPLSIELISTPTHDLNVENLQVYFEEEILNKLPERDKEILRQASIYRYPVAFEALLSHSGQDFSNVHNLTNQTLLLQTSEGKYFVHDLIKDFLSTRLSIHKKREVHGFAARFYSEENHQRSDIETMYHLIQAQKYVQVTSLILQKGRELLFRGFAKELHEYIGKLEAIGGLGESTIFMEENADLFTIHAEIDIVMGDWTGAEKHLKKALEFYKKQENSSGMALALKDLGGLHLRKGEEEEGISKFQQSLIFYKELDDDDGISKIQNNLGIAFWQRGEIEKAREALTQSLEISETNHEIRGIARALTNLGIIEFQHGDIKKAVEHYDRALKLSQEQGDRKTLAQLYDNLGEAYRLMGDKEKALDYFDQGIELAESHGFRYITAQLCKDLSKLLEGDEKEYYNSLASEICKELGIKEEKEE